MTQQAPYFERMTQYMHFEEQCFDCLNYRSIGKKIPLCKCKENDNEAGFGCTITDMFHLHQNTLSDEHRKTLLPNYKCPMRLTIEEAKIRGELIAQKQILALQQKVAELKNGQQTLF